MAIGSHVLAPPKDSPPARTGMPVGEFLLTLLVVVAATLVGAAGGIWLAERGRSAVRPETSAPQTSLQTASRAHSEVPRLPVADRPPVPVSKTAAKRSDAEIVQLGLPSIRAFRHRSEADYTEIAFELRAADLLRAARLHNPERIYFDLADAGRKLGPNGRLKSRRSVQMRDDRVAGVRLVRWESGSVRVVVDLRRACEYSYRLTPAPGSLLTLRLWTHPADTLADRKAPHQGAAGISEAMGADRP